MKLNSLDIKANTEWKKLIEKNNSNQPKIIYELVGNMVKVYSVDEEGVKVCLKSIPLEAVTPEVINKIQNISPLEKLVVLEKIKAAQQEDHESNTAASLPLQAYQEGQKIKHKQRQKNKKIKAYDKNSHIES